VISPANVLPFVCVRRTKSMKIRAHVTSNNLAVLMMAIDNPTEAAAMQMMASRKLIVFFNKIFKVQVGI
jgi:hypothetical protein